MDVLEIESCNQKIDFYNKIEIKRNKITISNYWGTNYLNSIQEIDKLTWLMDFLKLHKYKQIYKELHKERKRLQIKIGFINNKQEILTLLKEYIVSIFIEKISSVVNKIKANQSCFQKFKFSLEEKWILFNVIFPLCYMSNNIEMFRNKITHYYDLWFGNLCDIEFTIQKNSLLLCLLQNNKKICGFIYQFNKYMDKNNEIFSKKINKSRNKKCQINDVRVFWINWFDWFFKKVNSNEDENVDNFVKWWEIFIDNKFWRFNEIYNNLTDIDRRLENLNFEYFIQLKNFILLKQLFLDSRTNHIAPEVEIENLEKIYCIISHIYLSKNLRSTILKLVFLIHSENILNKEMKFIVLLYTWIITLTFGNYINYNIETELIAKKKIRRLGKIIAHYMNTMQNNEFVCKMKIQQWKTFVDYCVNNNDLTDDNEFKILKSILRKSIYKQKNNKNK
ncbi:hypothetical protein [Mycoplasma hafezii]|uniref:hypothetical protein n=1 Tax=Mycoplasma hafezii TaxID=525886 RepID=UPI003CF08D45